MCDPATIIGITGLVLGGSKTGYDINKSIHDTNDAKDEAGRQKVMQAKALADADAATKEQKATEDAATAQANSDAAALQNRDEAKRLRSLYGQGKSNRGGTILTSPLGLSGTANTANRTLLGA